LTPATLLQHSSKIDHLTETVKGASTGGTGQLRIGDAGVLTTEVIAPALRRLRKDWPNLRLSVVQNTSEGFFNDLLDHRLIRPTPMLHCYLVYRKNASSPLLKSFISICLELSTTPF
jgi:hypothetical protein